MHIGNIILLLSPAIWLTVTAIIVLLAGVVASKRPDKGLDHYFATQHVAPLAMMGALILQGMVIVYSLGLVGRTMQATINGVLTDIPAVGLFVTEGGHAQLTVDPFAAILSFVAIAGTLIVMLLSLEHFGEHQIHKAEYYSLLMFATVAASLAAASSDLIAIYLCIEFLSLTSYILAAFVKTDRRSAEAGLKYFLYGAACSAIMLYGMSILFGITGGNTSLSAIAAGFAPGKAAFTGVGWVAIMFTLVGLGFKLALVPFHFWAPDTYEGAPTPVTAFLSVVSKAAGLAVIIRFLTVVATPSDAASLSWYWILVVLTALSMLYGNLVAIWQSNIKRMLAYSSIAQVGYMMVGVLVAMHTFTRGGSALGVPNASVRANVTGESIPMDIQGVLIYVIAYLFMNLGAFAVVIAVGKRMKTDAIESYAGLVKHAPFYASALAVFLFSLAGVPPTAGFLGKFFVFGSAIKMGSPELVVLAILGVVNSVISAYYYMNVVRLMFFMPSKHETKVFGTTAINAAIIVSLVLTLALVVFAKPVSDIAAQAVYTHNPVHIISTGR